MLKDGGLRAVLLVSSINFSLKSEDEQNALISSYASFLNTLDFPLQIVIQSRRLNIDEYIERLNRAEKEQTNDLLRVQIADYRDFIAELVKLADIMSKRFYVVVPYDPLGDTKKGFWPRFKELFSPATFLRLEEKKFWERRSELLRRTSHVLSGLQAMGLQAVQMNTYNLIELFYETYNPDEALSQRLVEIGKLRTE